MTGTQIAMIVASYVLGSVPTGYWLGKAWKGIDVRQHGSGNLGATNVYRVLGPKAALFTFTVDCLKGMVPVIVSQHLFPNTLLVPLLTGVAAILGHTTSVFVHFRGGKGMATATGVFAALSPLPSLVAITVFITTLCITRYVSLGSILGALTLVMSSFIFPTPRALLWTSITMAAFVIWKHRANIERLYKGTENRMEWKKKAA